MTFIIHPLDVLVALAINPIIVNEQHTTFFNAIVVVKWIIREFMCKLVVFQVNTITAKQTTCSTMAIAYKIISTALFTLLIVIGIDFADGGEITMTLILSLLLTRHHIASLC